MSLILDALRKAEAERTRGTVPGLHSVAATAPAAPPAPAAGRRGVSAAAPSATSLSRSARPEPSGSAQDDVESVWSF